MTMLLMVSIALVPVGWLSLGSEDVAKKPDGKLSVILLAAASAPPAVV